MGIEEYHPENLSIGLLVSELIRIAGVVNLIDHGFVPVASDGHEKEKLSVLTEIVISRMSN